MDERSPGEDRRPFPRLRFAAISCILAGGAVAAYGFSRIAGGPGADFQGANLLLAGGAVALIGVAALQFSLRRRWTSSRAGLTPQMSDAPDSIERGGRARVCDQCGSPTSVAQRFCGTCGAPT